MENTVDKNAEALEKISEEFRELITYTEPESLHGVVWDMFQSFLTSNEGDCLPENIYMYTLVYEFFRNTCRELENIQHVPGYRFKISYEPTTELI